MLGIPKSLRLLFTECHWSTGIHFCHHIMHYHCYMDYKKGVFIV